MNGESGGNGESTKVLVSECPMSWCTYTSIVEAPDTPYDAAYEIQEHVNGDHSEKDIETLGQSVDAGGEQ